MRRSFRKQLAFKFADKLSPPKSALKGLEEPCRGFFIAMEEWPCPNDAEGVWVIGGRAINLCESCKRTWDESYL